ncbi:MAG: type II secretion system F family protein [Armatimonadetes bacterium]|nr:type II secretion system F family protein [Armatimonadota bacterium]
MDERRYFYRARTAGGELITAELTAESEIAAAAALKSRGYIPLEIRPVFRRPSRPGERISFALLPRRGVGAKEMAVFCRQMAAMLHAGVTLSDALKTLTDQQAGGRLKSILRQAREEIRKGSSFSAALEKHGRGLGEFLVNMVRVGEASGALDEVFARLSVHFEKEAKLRQKVASALIYPVILVLVTIVVVGGLVLFVLPQFAEIFARQGARLPLPTRVLLAAGTFLKGNLPAVLPAALGAGALLYRFFTRPRGRLLLDRLSLILPVLKDVQQKVIVARLCRSLQTMLRSGIVLTDALNTARGIVGNSIYKNGLRQITQEIERGRHFSELIAGRPAIFPPFFVQMAVVGEQAGVLEEMLEKTADFYDAEVEHAVERATALIEPLVLIFLGLGVGALVMSIILPLFDTYRLLGK